MRRVVAVAVLLAASHARAAGTPPPSCPIGTNWTTTWSQADVANSGATGITLTLTSPCHVFADTDFIVTAQVTDTYCASGWDGVATNWKITDMRLDGTNATSTIAGLGSPAGAPGSGQTQLQTFDGHWLTTVKQRYTGIATDHRILFAAVVRKPDSCTPPAHFWSATVIGTTTYDPYATGETPPPGDPTTAAAAPAPESAGGCASAGVTPALLGLAALVAAAWPRRRPRG